MEEHALQQFEQDPNPDGMLPVSAQAFSRTHLVHYRIRDQISFSNDHTERQKRRSLPFLFGRILFGNRVFCGSLEEEVDLRQRHWENCRYVHDLGGVATYPAYAEASGYLVEREVVDLLLQKSVKKIGVGGGGLHGRSLLRSAIQKHPHGRLVGGSLRRVVGRGLVGVDVGLSDTSILFECCGSARGGLGGAPISPSTLSVDMSPRESGGVLLHRSVVTPCSCCKYVGGCMLSSRTGD